MEDIAQLFDDLIALIGSKPCEDERKRHTILELMVRLTPMRQKFVECTELNNEILDLGNRLFNPFRWDPSREAFVIDEGGETRVVLQLHRKDPDTPIPMTDQGSAANFVPGGTQYSSDDEKRLEELQVLLFSRTEELYDLASRWWNLLEKQLLGRKKSRFIGVQMVRNKLIVHADDTFSDSEHGYINSVGAQTANGPVLKPTRYESQTKEFQDAGLGPNMREMLEKAKAEFS